MILLSRRYYYSSHRTKKGARFKRRILLTERSSKADVTRCASALNLMGAWEGLGAYEYAWMMGWAFAIALHLRRLAIDGTFSYCIFRFAQASAFRQAPKSPQMQVCMPKRRVRSFSSCFASVIPLPATYGILKLEREELRITSASVVARWSLKCGSWWGEAMVQDKCRVQFVLRAKMSKREKK